MAIMENVPFRQIVHLRNALESRGFKWTSKLIDIQKPLKSLKIPK